MIKCGIDLGGTNIKFGFFNGDRLIQEKSIKTSKNIDEIIPSIINTIKESYNIAEIKGYTLALPGVVKDDIVIYAPNTNIVGLNFYKELSEALSNKNIVIDNDANMAALAESKLTNIKDLIVITLGTGIGGGIIIDGNIYNKNGFAGEVGHIKVDFSSNAKYCNCGKYGCVEAYASAKTIVEDYNKKYNTNITSKELFTMNTEASNEALANGFDKLGILIANLTTTLAIKDVRITGGMSLAGKPLIDGIRAAYLKYALPTLEDVNIELASLGGEAGIYAARYIID